ncbi:MAG TPA: ATP-grasp domain-containing protein [Vicinamibacterales bacterium]|nr:ATP-grasp domain-containing protein [Vicinamibacterales bacterium]
MNRVLLLATTTGYQTRSFGEAADKLGVELVFATDRCVVLDDPWRDNAVAIRFHDEPASVEAIVQAAEERPLHGILVVGDRPTVIAARAAEQLNLPGNPPDATAVARNKELSRARWQAEGMLVPWFRSTSIDADPSELAASLSYPCVVKPVALSGSRGVMRADDPARFVVCFERLRSLLRSPEVRAERNEANRVVLVEDFIPGREYALEGLLHQGDLRVLALFDKPDPLDGPFFEETIYTVPSSAPDAVQEAIVQAVAAAARAIGLRHGPVHAECRVNAVGVFVLEVAARPIGGLCARSLAFVRATADDHRISLEELLLRHALGESPETWIRESSASGVMMIPIPQRGILRGVQGVDEARQVANVDDVRITAKVGQLLVPLPEGASYLGFIFARAERPSTVDAALRAAHARLRFLVDPELPMASSVQSSGAHEAPARGQIDYNHQHG